MNRSVYLTLVAILALNVRQPADAAVLTLNASRDTSLLQTTSPTDYSDDNFGGLSAMTVGSFRDGRVNSLIGFDLTGLPGTGMIVTSATLRLFYNDAATTGAGRTINVYEVTSTNSNWVEGTAVLSGATDDGATWIDRDGTGALGAWTGAAGLESPGTAYYTPDLSSQFVSTTIADKASIDFTLGTGQYASLTEMIESWSSNMPGLLLRDPGSTFTGTDRVAFYAREEVETEALAPQLILTLEALPVPEPSTLTLAALGFLVLLKRRRS